MRKKILIVTLSAFSVCSALAHGLSPQRVESPAGSDLVAYKFTASSSFKEPQLYEVECFKEDFKHPAECEAIPGEFWVAPYRKRYVKIQIRTSGDGVYLACTKQVPKDESGAGVITRVCARWGVGVSPASNKSNSAKQHKPSSGSTIQSRNRQNKSS